MGNFRSNSHAEIINEALIDLFGKRLAAATKEVRRFRSVEGAQKVLTSAQEVLEVMEDFMLPL